MEPSISQIDPGRLKHLEMLQAVITRMASNSFLVKGWSLTLFSAILVAGAKESSSVLWIAIVPVVSFWILDGFFLRQERLYRGLYDHIRSQPLDSPTDFSMSTHETVGVASWPIMIFSKTSFLFHFPLLLVLGIVFYFLTFYSCSCC
jgi:hypothetical protein